MKIVDMSLELTTHRLLFKSTTQHALLIKGETITNVSILVIMVLHRKKDFFPKIISSNWTLSMVRPNYHWKATIKPRLALTIWSRKKLGIRNQPNKKKSPIFTRECSKRYTRKSKKSQLKDNKSVSPSQVLIPSLAIWEI